MGSSISQEEMTKAQDIVEEIIKTNKIVVFSKTYCPYCRRAKEVLKQHGVQFFVMELDVEELGSAIQQYLQEKTGQRTVPNIFINEQHIGGCDDLMKLNSSGELKKLLQ
ncbi:Putative Glutaredoxin [Rhizopus microsporus]|nr:Putative Glutaredoxin [Rhizopus microsporus]